LQALHLRQRESGRLKEPWILLSQGRLAAMRHDEKRATSSGEAMTSVHEVLKERRERAKYAGTLLHEYADRIERALAPAGEVDGPVAWMKTWFSPSLEQRGCRVDLTPICEPWLDALNPTITPLYASPPAAPQGWNEAIEAAAKVADEYRAACEKDGSIIGQGTARIIAATIRALKQPAAAPKEGT
jgi:hypothetical protein